MKSALSRVGAAVGAVYVLVGIAGFTVTTGGGQMGSGPMNHGSHLLWFQVNPLHNMVHIALGALLLVAATRGAFAARQAMLLVGSVYLLLGLAGPMIMGTSANVVGVNNADHLLHVITAVLLIGAAVVLGRRLQPVS
jgi:hypothetical protein